MKHFSGLFLYAGFFLFISCSEKRSLIEKSIQTELDNYPELSLRDIYKNFFQDAYGPGHLIADTARAAGYLDWELAQAEWSDTLKWQALGSENDFYRINLSLLKQGIIPRNMLLQAMVESAPMARKPDIESWKKEWAIVLSIIRKMKLQLPGFEDDQKMIEEMLSRGEVVMHHSEHYVEKYHPHYRIIHRSIFEKWKTKYFANNQMN